ncbi:MAG: Rieske 2Fe-2S domain-containing protein [Chloroflexi bacterium]|nr:Rieske 2Fe-2S domain-containing protein [Chloroflexota bacterium]
MLSARDNELITRVGSGTPMGDLLRLYWIPFLFSWEVTADGNPERVRLLGEDLIAFRDTAGTVGLIQNNCPHRGASLFFGRNEEAGLRCVYHGWKFDVAGRCVDMPNEPAESDFRTKVSARVYPCLERAGVVWVYMGPQNPPPPLPGLEWLDLPEDHLVASKRVQDTNWVQAMEGDVDQSHLSFTHSSLRPAEDPSDDPRIAQIRKLDKHPRFEVVRTRYGTCIGAGRKAPDDQRYWRITQHLMPFHTMTGPYGKEPLRNWRAWVPIDDTTCVVIGVTFQPRRPLTVDERTRVRTPTWSWTIAPEHRAPPTSRAFGRWRSSLGAHNDFGIDRRVQRTETFSGIPEFWAQDAAPQVGMGPIFDRTTERLGTSDLAIIAVRRRLLESAKALQDGGVVPGEIFDPACYAVRSDALLLGADESWFEATTERRKAIAGVNPDCA